MKEESGRVKHCFLAGSHCRREIYIMDGNGRLVWTYPVLNPQDLWMLADGSIAFAWKNGVRRVDRNGRTLFDFPVASPDEVPSLQPLGEGRWLVGIVGRCELLELEESSGVVSRLKLTTSASGIHSQFRFCRKTLTDSYLVPFTAEGAVREYDWRGRILWELEKLPTPVGVLRLPDGDTLISMAGSVRRYAPDRREVWRFSGEDVPGVDFAIAAGMQLLRNGNLVFTNWGSRQRDGRRAVHILEVSAGREVVWECASPLLGEVGQCQLLNETFEKSAESVLR